MPDLAQLYDELAETCARGRHLFDTTPILAEFDGVIARKPGYPDAEE